MKKWWPRIRPSLPLALATVAWVVFFTLSMLCSRQIERLYSGMSLRYTAPISSDAGAAARRFSAASGNEAWPTFWTEETAELQGSVSKENCTTIWYSGNANLVWPATFLVGAYPAVLDDAGVAVSAQTAWALWGSFDVMGFEVMVDGKPYRVCGVFEDDTPMVLASVGEAPFEAGWAAVELEGQAEGDAQTLAEDYALRSGMGAPGAVINGPAIAALCRVVGLLPAMLLVLAYCIRFIRWAFARWPKYRAGLLFGLLLVAALLLPALLDSLPPALVPNRWSDFAFWQRLGQQLADAFTGYLRIHPCEIDLRAKLNLLGLMVCGLVSLFFSIILVVLMRRKKVEHGGNTATGYMQSISGQCDGGGQSLPAHTGQGVHRAGGAVRLR